MRNRSLHLQAHWWANPQDGLNCTTEQVVTIIIIIIIVIINIIINIAMQILAALQGTMVMEIQPISSCSEAARSEGLCRRTISSKVGSICNNLALF